MQKEKIAGFSPGWTCLINHKVTQLTAFATTDYLVINLCTDGLWFEPEPVRLTVAIFVTYLWFNWGCSWLLAMSWRILVRKSGNAQGTDLRHDCKSIVESGVNPQTNKKPNTFHKCPKQQLHHFERNKVLLESLADQTQFLGYPACICSLTLHQEFRT